jgi:predicted methyltransferase
VLDMFSGGGYYTEILSHIAGPDGKVVAHTNSAYANFLGDETSPRYADNRLANVEHLPAENNTLALPEDEFDAVMLVLSYHDIYLADAENDWPQLDGPKMLAELKKGLKPGGILAIIDQYAAAGSPPETGGTLHRIDPQIVIEDLVGAGFVVESKSDLLRNRQDNLSTSMYEADRGTTDRFILSIVCVARAWPREHGDHW